MQIKSYIYFDICRKYISALLNAVTVKAIVPFLEIKFF